MSLRSKIIGLRQICTFENYLFLILTRIFFPAETIQIYRGKDYMFLADHSAGDANTAREVLTTPMYRRYLEQMSLPSGCKILDLGSNNGGFTILIKSLGIEIEKAVCVEMNPNTFARLQYNLALNLPGRSTAINGAVCGKKGTLTVHLGSGSASDNIYQQENASTTQFSISGWSFDDIFAETFGGDVIDVCKIDIEGAEFEMFAAKSAKMISLCRYVLIEIHNETDRPRRLAVDELVKLGFTESTVESVIDEKHYVHFFINDKLHGNATRMSN